MQGLGRVSWRYLAAEAGLFLLLSYLVLLGGTYNGLILFGLNQVNFILLVVLGCAWLAWRFWRGRPFPATSLDKPLLVLAVACLLVTLLSSDPRRSAITLVQLIFYILLFYCLVDLLRSGLDADLLIKVWLFSSLVVMIFSVIQIGFWYKSWIDLAGWHRPIPSVTIRISAFLGHPNFMAAYLNLLLPLGIVRAFQSRSRIGQAGWSIWALVMLALIFFTSSRGGWFGTGTVLGILILLSIISKWQIFRNWLGGLLRQRKGAVAGLVIILAVVGMAGYILLKWQSKNPTHASSGLDFMSRSYIWQVAWRMFSSHPILGNGPFTFGTQFIQNNSVPPALLLAHAHNFLFNVAAEAGIVGVAAFGWVILTFLYLARKNWRLADGRHRLVLTGLLASLGGLVVHSLFDTPELLPLIGIMIVNFTALVVASGSRATGLIEPRPELVVNQKTKKFVFRPGWSLGLVVLCIIMFCLSGWAVWAYAPAARGADAANSGDWASTAKDFESAGARDPLMAFNWLQAGFARGQMALGPDGGSKDANNLRAAIGDYQRGMAIEPVYATNWANISLLEWAAGNQMVALADMQKASEVAPGQPAFLLTYGRMLEMAQQPEQARVVYRQVLDASPAWARTYFFRATPLRLDVVKQWRAETKQPEANNLAADAGSTAIEISGFGLTDGQSIADNQLALGQSYTQQGDFKSAIAAFKSALAMLEQTTSYGIGQMGTSQYGWYIFNRQSIDADLLPGMDYPVYTDDVVSSMLMLADDYQKLGDPASARLIYSKILQVAPDNQLVHERIK